MKASNRIGGLVPRPRGRLGNQRGMALMVALLVLVVMSALGFAMLSLSQTEVQVGRSQHESMRALYLADAAVERARAELNRRLENPVAYGQPPPKPDFDIELTTNGGYLYGSATAFATLADSGGTTVGEYRLQVVNNNTGPDPDGGTATDDLDRAVYVVGTGRRTFMGHTVQRRVEALLSPSDLAAFTMGCGNPGEQQLMINGNPTINGALGSVHTNCGIAVTGDPDISEDLTASGTISPLPGPGEVDGTVQSGADPRTIPPIRPTDFRNSTYMQVGDYVMRETTAPVRAQVYQVTGFDLSGNPILSGLPVFTAHNGASAAPPWPSGAGGWGFTGTPGVAGSTWFYSGNDVPGLLQNRVFYFERVPGSPANGNSANVQISSNPGTAGGGIWQASIIAEGHIDISGNLMINPDTTARNLQLVSGTDITLSGATTANYVGGSIIAAHEQISISGNPTINGIIMVENFENLDGWISEVFISGNPTITYSGAPPPPAAWNMGLLRITWRELP